NPCAAKNPCNPCAAKNPCNPCGAKNPCNPCAASEAAELTPTEAKKAYDCMKGGMRAAYAKSGDKIAQAYGTWKRYNKTAYVSDTHGGRYVNNFANRKGAKYGKFEKAGRMPKGAILAKDSFAASPNGQLSVGPLFIMRKMGKGFSAASGDWRYSMIMPNGSSFGVTGGKGSNNVKFCYECHINADVDSMFFLPEEARK
ncbi:MAG: cytochrome P460 family protein, partial [Alphaproteobacteria bacterium]